MIIRLAMFFSFFISFAAINFIDYHWALLWSWIFSSIFVIYYLIPTCRYIYQENTRLDERYKITIKMFLTIFSVSLISWILQALEIISIPSEYEISIIRSIGHTLYLLFYFIVFNCVYVYLIKNERNYFLYFKWMFIYSFVFISAWGIYQYISTYDIVSYSDILNNSISTGFTYDRFKDEHRVSSVFPEPSEYSYYLAFQTPIIWAYFRNKFFISSLFARYFLIFLLLTQIYMIRSLSYIIAIPVIIWVIAVYIERKKGLKLLLAYSLLSLVGALVVGITMYARINALSGGNDGSVDDRLVGMFNSLDLFSLSPLVGFGYGITRGIDQLFFLLASLGFIGTILLLRYIILFIMNKNVPHIMSGSLLAMFASCISSNNILGYLFYWLILAFLSSYPNKQNSYQN